MKSSELDYSLPRELIAQRPLERRDHSRLLVYERSSGEVRHRRFDELPEELAAGTLTVVNDTRVLPGRLRLERFFAGSLRAEWKSEQKEDTGGCAATALAPAVCQARPVGGSGRRRCGSREPGAQRRP